MRVAGYRIGGNPLRRLIAVALLLSPATARAAERAWSIGAFDRLRVEGPLAVEVTTGAAQARADAPDLATLERLTIKREGSTLVVRLPGTPAAGLGQAPGVPPSVRVTLATPVLAAVSHQGTGTVRIARLEAERVDIAATGGGATSVGTVEARTLAATLVGSGTMTLRGRAAEARLVLNGDGLLDAAALAGDDSRMSLVGDGEMRAAARYAAAVVARGEGRVTVTGIARCDVRAFGGATVRCAR